MDHMERCAIKMQSFLNSKPRSHKTRKYLCTLPKRQKIRVEPSEFERGKDCAKILIAHLEQVSASTVVRKDRVRPKAKCQKPSRVWNCRSANRQKPWSNGPRLSREYTTTLLQRKVLYRAQGGICGLCGSSMEGEASRYSLDHVVPLSLGGEDRLGNLLLCHGECNGQKSNDVPTGCEMIALIAVNSVLEVHPQVF